MDFVYLTSLLSGQSCIGRFELYQLTQERYCVLYIRLQTCARFLFVGLNAGFYLVDVTAKIKKRVFSRPSMIALISPLVDIKSSSIGDKFRLRISEELSIKIAGTTPALAFEVGFYQPAKFLYPAQSLHQHRVIYVRSWLGLRPPDCEALLTEVIGTLDLRVEKSRIDQSSLRRRSIERRNQETVISVEVAAQGCENFPKLNALPCCLLHKLANLRAGCPFLPVRSCPQIEGEQRENCPPCPLANFWSLVRSGEEGHRRVECSLVRSDSFFGGSVDPVHLSHLPNTFDIPDQKVIFA